MKRIKLYKMRGSLPGLIGLTVLLISCSVKNKTSETSKNTKPNVIFILADDLGYGDVGFNGQQLIETPNLDQLAADGMRFTQFYAGAPVCAPSRCILLTGKHSGHAEIRGNDEWGERGDVWNYRAQLADSTLEGQRPLRDDTETIANKMKTAGYSTGMIGKWGLGAPNTNSTPNKKGFDFFVGYNCQRQAHTFYPVHLWKNDKKLILGNDTVAPGTKLDPGADPYNPASYSKYTLQSYSPDVMFKEMMGFVEEHKDEPFFFYWATPIPHAPLQAPQRWIDYYVKKFGNEEPYLADKGYFPQRYPHAAYAAMISYLDENIGKLVQKLKDEGIYDNTLIIFTSDNGPTYNGGTDSPWFNSGGPFKSEFGWGKGFVHEGGFREPMIATWPAKIKAGSESNHISAFWDVMPTLCEIAGIETPADADGISFLPTLLGEKQPEHPYLYWEFPETGGQQAVRMGNWKGIRKNIKKGNLKLELYDLNNDIQEKNDIADQHPDIIRQMEDIMVNEHELAIHERFRMEALGDDVKDKAREDIDN